MKAPPNTSLKKQIPSNRYTSTVFAALRLLSVGAVMTWMIQDTGAEPKLIANGHSKSNKALYENLCELNTQWEKYTPRYAALPVDWKSDGDVNLIKTHLFLILDKLKKKDVSHMNDLQKSNRRDHITGLEKYMHRGIFPINTLWVGRRPVFIDSVGTHCAVGKLIYNSGFEKLAKKINDEHQLSYLNAIKTQGLVKWQENSGLALDELALIQPSYAPAHYTELQKLIMAGKIKDIIAAIEKDPTKLNKVEEFSAGGGRSRAAMAPLQFAMERNQLDIVKALLKLNAKVDTTSMAMAVRKQNIDLMEKMVANGASYMWGNYVDKSKALNHLFTLDNASKENTIDFQAVLLQFVATAPPLGDHNWVQKEAVIDMESLLKHMKKNGQLDKKQPYIALLCWSQGHHCVERLKLLIKYGVDTNARCQIGHEGNAGKKTGLEWLTYFSNKRSQYSHHKYTMQLHRVLEAYPQYALDSTKSAQ
jgi:hypothetical protein|tara:strand:+ start:308 stop:1735 length:1428 start_codon:yes stop_codon:yes gene_type:complete